MNATAHRAPTLLIVDDDARVRELAEVAAQRTGLFGRVESVYDGGSALAHLTALPDEHLPSVVLTDLSMPQLDGLELVRLLRQNERFADLPIVMFSSSNRPNDEELAIEAGCQAFFHKPVSLDDLMRIMSLVAQLGEKSVAART